MSSTDNNNKTSNKSKIVTLASTDSSIAKDDVLGEINFKTPYEKQASSDLVLHYKLDDTNIQNKDSVIDSSGYGHSGTINDTDGSFRNVPGHVGKLNGAYSFDGSNDYISISNPSTSLTGNLTLSMWIKRDDTSETGKTLISKYFAREFDLTFWGNLTLYNGTTTGGDNYYYFNGPLTSSFLVNTWYHITVVRSGSGTSWTANFYVNGSLNITDTTPVRNGGGSGNNTPQSSTLDINIGARNNNGSPEKYFNGSIDNVRIYDRALNAQEILNIYNSTTDNSIIYNNYITSSIQTIASHAYNETIGGSWSYTHLTNTWTTSVDHNLLVGDPIIFTAIGSAPDTYLLNTVYYVISPITNTTLKLSKTSGGSVVIPTSTSDSSGTWNAKKSAPSSDIIIKNSNSSSISEKLRVDNTGTTKFFGNTEIKEEKNVSEFKPVGHWLLDEGSGTQAMDSSGLGFTGTIYGNPSWTDDKNGNPRKALQFDGSDDYITNGTIVSSGLSTFFGKTAWTISMWINSDVASTDSSDRYVINMGYYTGIFIWSYSGTVWDQCWGVANNTSNFAKAKYSTTLETNTWYHTTATYDSVNLKIYLNGVLDNTAAESGPLLNPTTDLFIGTKSTTEAYDFKGKMYDVRIYDQALPEHEINKIYQDTKESITFNNLHNNLVGWWKLNGTFNDSINGNHGTIAAATNQPTLTSDYNGIGGNAYRFDGSNDYVYNNTLVYDGMTNYFGRTNFTISCWVYSEEASTTTANRIVIDAGYTTGVFYWSESSNSTSDKSWQVWSDSWKKAQYTSDLNANTWYHILATYDNSNLKAYLNGELEVTTAAAGPLAIPESGLNLGMQHDGQYYFKGKIADVRIYNRALTLSEVKSIYNPAGGNLVVNNFITGNPDNYPILHYKLDESSGGVATDSSGNGYDSVNFSGQTGGGPTLTVTGYDSVINGAYRFDGSNNYLESNLITSGDSAFWGRNVWTISLWIKSDDAVSGTQQTVINFGTGCGVFNWGHSSSPDDRQAWLVDPGSAVSAKYTTDLQTNTWYHICASFKWTTGTNGILKAYLNGLLENCVTGLGQLNAPTSKLYIGADSSSQYFFNGQIDDVRIYSTELSHDEIKKLYIKHQKLGIQVKDYGRVEVDGNIYVKQSVPTTSTYRPVSIFPTIQEVSSTGNNWVSLKDVISGICIKMVGAGGGGGTYSSTINGTVGGGGGSGSYAEVYITKDDLDIRGASHIYFSIGSGGSGGSGSESNGTNGGTSSCKIAKSSVDTTGSSIFNVNHGEGGQSSNNGAGGGDGGGEQSISIGSGYCIPGEPGENGIITTTDYSWVSGKRGGQSKLGSAGAGQTQNSAAMDGVNGGGGGSGSNVRSGYTYDGTNGGDAYAIVYIY